MRAIKNEWFLKSRSGRGLFASEFVAEVLKIEMTKKTFFTEFFGEDVILIPVPRSSLIQKNALWPSFQIAKALEDEGFGIVEPILERVNPVPRSSKVPPEQRPSPIDHAKSMCVKKSELLSHNFLLVDDIVTRGHTFMGSAWCLQDAFPNADITAFAAMRTVSNESEFRNLIDPVTGQIIYRPEHNDCLRRP